MNKETINTLILPDIHCRDFWKEPVKTVLEETNANIVFLGDYLDGYPWEWGTDKDLEYDVVEDYKQHGIDNFKEIIELKKRYPNRITILIGNHDGGYCITDDICSCRTDYQHKAEIESIFNENRNLFQIASEITINGRHFIFSHAGILKGWVKSVFDEKYINNDSFNIVDALNNAWLANDVNILYRLGDYDYHRGYLGYEFGSPIWSDIRSWAKATESDTYGFNIVGHTQLESDPVVFETIVDLDCRRAFYLDNDGKILDFSDDTVIKE